MVTSSLRTESENNMSKEVRLLASCRRSALAALIAVLAAGEASAGDEAQTFEDFFGAYTHRIEGVTIGAGDAAASNAASQIINPWPVYSGNRDILSESPRMIGAIRRYQNNSDASSMDPPNLAGPQANPDASPALDAASSPSLHTSPGE
jgi:hypothetical protein